MKKIISIVLILTLIFSIMSVSYATDVITRMQNEASDAANNNSNVNNLGGAIIGAIQVGATVVAIALLLFVGIKFMMAAPAEKANLKGALIPYLVGAVLIFAAVPIISMIRNFSKNIS